MTMIEIILTLAAGVAFGFVIIYVVDKITEFLDD